MTSRPRTPHRRVTRRLPLLACGVAWLLLATLSTPARAQSPLSVVVSDVDDSLPAARAILTVDRAGRPVIGVAPADVTVTLDGNVASVAALDAATDEAIPLTLILVVDTSGSMENQIALVREAARGIIDRLDRSDRAAVIAFDSEVRLLQPLTSDRQLLASAVDTLEALGDTALYDAVQASGELAVEAGARRQAVVLLTDGQDFGGVSTSARQQSLDVAAGAASYYTIGVGDSVDADYLAALAERSGGRSFSASTPQQITDAYATIESLLRTQYILTFERSPGAGGVPRTIAVTVTVDGEAATGRATFTSAAPAAPPPPPASTAAAQEPPAAAPDPIEVAPVAAPVDGDSRATGWALLVLSPLLASAAAWIVWRRLRSRDAVAVVSAPPTFDARPIAVAVPSRPRPTFGQLTIEDHPLASRAVVGDVPVAIGSGPECGLVLRAAIDVAPLHARVWTRDGRVMLHHLGNGHDTRVNGRTVEWAVLKDGDEIAIGPNRLRFAAKAPPAATTGDGT
jgi:VWFA-related protein